MKPDTPNPGQVNATPEKSNLEAQSKESGLSRSEAAPQPGSSSTTTDDNQKEISSGLNPSDSSHKATELAQSNNSQGEGFQSTIAQLPAEDSEKIEQEWVDKADQIEQVASGDPYHQDDAQHELSRAYLKKRFGLDIK